MSFIGQQQLLEYQMFLLNIPSLMSIARVPTKLFSEGNNDLSISFTVASLSSETNAYGLMVFDFDTPVGAGAVKEAPSSSFNNMATQNPLFSRSWYFLGISNRSVWALLAFAQWPKYIPI